MSLTKRTENTGPAYPGWWTVAETWTWRGKPVEKGWTVRVKGVRGTATFVNHTTAPPRPGSGKRLTKEWVTVINGTGYHSYLPERVTAVYPPIKKRAPRNELHRAPQAHQGDRQADQAVPSVGRPRATRAPGRTAGAQRGAGQSAPHAQEAGGSPPGRSSGSDADPSTEDGRGLTAYDAGWSAWMEQ